MKLFYITSLTAGIAMTGMAFAMSHVAGMDTDGDGVLAYEEILAVFPSITEGAFIEADANGDGSLDADELQAAEETGLVPMKDG